MVYNIIQQNGRPLWPWRPTMPMQDTPVRAEKNDAAAQLAARAAGPITPRKKRRFLEGTSAERKTFPITEGVLDYFPDAIAAVALISYVGNMKHNPGQPLHWARDKSMDHADCIARHLIERGGFDTEVIGGVEYKLRHTAALVWRGLALLQEEVEREYGLEKPRNATALPSR